MIWLLYIAVFVTSVTDIRTLSLLLLINTISEETLHVITGNMLGDGCLRRTGRKRDGQPTGNARFEMNKGPAAYNQVTELFSKHYQAYSGVGFRENTYYSGSLKQVFTQYHIFTKSLPVFTLLHSFWYNWDPISMKYIKTVPLDISLMFSPLSLAHWIIDDGYFTDKTIVLCTDNFTKHECERLQVLLLKYNILSGLIIQKGKYRIRLYQSSMPIVIGLVKRHMHDDFLYKLGPSVL